jgi:predicted transposase YbfD/YdcC
LPKKTFEIAKDRNIPIIVQLKDNQPTLNKAVSDGCAKMKPSSIEIEKDPRLRNRSETRTAHVFDAAPIVNGTEWEPYIKTIIQIHRLVLHYSPKTGLWNSSEEIAFYISNESIHAKPALQAVRSHWHVENTLHYKRDVTLREDASRIRSKPGIFARFRSFGYNILQVNKTDTMPQDRYALALGGINALSELKLCA